MKSTYYVLDAQGNQLSTYEHKPSEPPYELVERVIYGSSRLGINTKKVDMLIETQEDLLTSYTGEKLYEMSNHLGNVLTVINDIKVPYLEQDNLLFKATIVSTADYSPFGVQLDGRTVSADTYRYGFQGQEKDDEIKGAGNSVNYTYRMHDPRLGRFFAIDPLSGSYPYYSSYQFSGNRVIDAVELEGLELKVVHVILAKNADGTTSIKRCDVTFLNEHGYTYHHAYHGQLSSTTIFYSYEGHNDVYQKTVYEPRVYNNGLRPSSVYNYHDRHSMIEKFKDDHEWGLKTYGELYLLHPGYWANINHRDNQAIDARYENQGLYDVAELSFIFLLPGRAPHSVSGQNGIYHQGSGHYDNPTRTNTNKPKGAAPVDGQLSLDNSILYKTKGNGDVRIGRQGDDFVVFTREGGANTSANLYHAHVRTFKELDPKMQNFLRNNEFIKGKGNNGKWKD